MTSKEDCIQHHFGSDGRCVICQMKLTYYQDAMDVLSKWSKKEREEEKEHYDSIVKSYQCKPHFHTEMMGVYEK